MGLSMLLLEKLRGASPYLLDCTTFSGGSEVNKDSGVGESVECSDAGASSNMVSVLAQVHTLVMRKKSNYCKT
jgi:hypothetical protein